MDMRGIILTLSVVALILLAGEIASAPPRRARRP
jgi:hypothetical protein